MTTNNSANNRANTLIVQPSGTSTGQTGEIRLNELVANGTNFVSFKVTDALAADTPYTLPSAYPASSGQVLASDTSGVMSWSTAGIVGGNFIINPEMILAQRGTSFATIADGTYTMDRMQYGKSGTMVHTISQDTDVPTVVNANYLFQNSYLSTVTTAQASLGTTGSTNVLIHKIEGYNYSVMAQRAFTFSFWVKASITGTFTVTFSNSGLDRCYVSQYTVNSTNTWEKKTITVSAPPSAGTWNYTNGIGLRIDMNVASGTNLQTSTLNAWQTGYFTGSSSSTNGVATNAITFRFTGLRLELGSTANDFVGRDIATEVGLCQRYYQKTFNLTTTPASATESGLRASGVSTAAAAATSVLTGFSFPTRMRATPSVTTFNPFGAGSQIASAGLTATNTTLFTSSPLSLSFTFTVPATGASGSNFGVHYTCDSEL